MKISDLQEGPEREAMIQQFGADADAIEVARSLINTKAKLSSTRRVPGDDAPAEDWGSFYNSMGRPETPDAYSLPEVPDTLKSTIESLRSVAHEKGLTQAQFEALAQTAGAEASQADAQLEQARKSWEDQVREQHGEKADDRIAKAKSAMDKLLADDPVAAAVVQRFGLDKHPAIMNTLLKAHNAMSDDATPGVGSSPPAEQTGPSPQELFKEGMEIMKSDAYKNQRSPENAMAQARMHDINATLVAMGFRRGVADQAFRSRPTVKLPDGREFRIG